MIPMPSSWCFAARKTTWHFPPSRRMRIGIPLLRSPSEQDSAFPDKVDLFIQPDSASRSYYQFAATQDGWKFGCRHGIRSNLSGTAQTGEDYDSTISNRVSKVTGFTATVTKGTNEWIAFFTIPWKTLGGKPADYFGLLPTRTRWRAGEVSSPVAMDFNERPPVDLFIETHSSGATTVQAPQTSLTCLPSGILRWQRPALLSYPDVQTLRQIWEMQQTLNKPTDTNDLPPRLCLTQRWEDLLRLEGFNFSAGSGSIAEPNMAPYTLRRRINSGLYDKDMARACQELDIYLRKLDKASRDWFADGSPGDILDGEWKSISEVEAAQMETNVFSMRCLAGGHPVDLHLSLPQSGGIRIYGNNEGYFKPTGLLPIKAVHDWHSYTVETGNGKIVIQERPFEISFYDAASRQTGDLHCRRRYCL